MAKKKPRNKEKDKSVKAANLPEKPESDPPENPFDFGGLPQRDLKKNLGCG